MSSTVTTSRSTSAAPISSTGSPTRLASAPVSVVAAIAGLAGAVVVFAFAALADALGVPMLVGATGASHTDPITPASFSIGVVFCTFFGALIAVALARWAKRPAQTFLRVTVVLTVVSLVFPILASHTAVSTRITLELAHVIAALIVIPLVTWRLSMIRKQATR